MADRVFKRSHIDFANKLIDELVAAPAGMNDSSRRVGHFIDALEKARPQISGPAFKLIPKAGFWSSNQERAVTREQIMSWATRDFDLADGDRFWVSPRRFIGLTAVIANSRSWMLAAFVDSKCVASEECESAFDMMVHFDFWSEQLRDPQFPVRGL